MNYSTGDSIIYDAEGQIIAGKNGKGQYTVEKNEEYTSYAYADGTKEYYNNNGHIGGIDEEGEYKVLGNSYEYNEHKHKYFDENKYSFVKEECFNEQGVHTSGRDEVGEYNVERNEDGSYSYIYGEFGYTKNFDSQGNHISGIDDMGEYTVSADVEKDNIKYTYTDNSNGLKEKYLDKNYATTSIEQIDNTSNTKTINEAGSYTKTSYVDGSKSINGSSKLNTENYRSNGKVDNVYRQDNTGDCWLLSGITSIMMKPGGKDYIDSLVSEPDSNGDVKVSLPGQDIEYVISKNEFDAYVSKISTGDDDIKYFEIAMNKYAYDIRYHSAQVIKIDGGRADMLYAAVMPKDSKIAYEGFNSEKEYDFNNPKISYTVSNLTNASVKALSPDGNEYNLLSYHVYAVYKSEGDYVYLQDPNMDFDPNNPEANLIKVKNEDLNHWCQRIYSTHLS